MFNISDINYLMKDQLLLFKTNLKIEFYAGKNSVIENCGDGCLDITNVEITHLVGEDFTLQAQSKLLEIQAEHIISIYSTDKFSNEKEKIWSNNESITKLNEKILKIFSKIEGEEDIDEHWFPFIELSNGKFVVMDQDHYDFREVQNLEEFVRNFASGDYYEENIKAIIDHSEIAELQL